MQGTGVIVIDYVTTGDSPLKDVRVRQALNYAVDRQALINRFLAGATRPAGSGLRANVPGSDASIAPYAYDPAKAHTLLAEAGHGEGLVLKAVTFFVNCLTDNALAPVGIFHDRYDPVRTELETTLAQFQDNVQVFEFL